MKSGSPRMFFTVISDPDYDQRMIRICNSLSQAGYNVTLVGTGSRKQQTSTQTNYHVRKIHCRYKKGFLFYAEFNIRLFCFLLFQKMDLVCAIDLDSILPCYFISAIKRAKRVYDAHELFCEMEEIVTRPRIYRIWKRIEKFAVPKFALGYTVNEPIAKEFLSMYGVQYEVIRNVPLLRPLTIETKKKFILYQGAVNEGRCFETLIPAMKMVNVPLLICGTGNFVEKAKALARQHAVEDRVLFLGMVIPEELRKITVQAWVGVTLFSSTGKSNWLSLANRFFDYMNAGVPQICVDFPAYRTINDEFHFAELIPDTSPETIANALNGFLTDENKHQIMVQNCLVARDVLNWQEEEKKLVRFYQQILG